MKLIATTLVETGRHIVDADVSEQMTVVLLNGKGEHIVTVDDVKMFTVSPHMHMLRIVGSELVLYDGQVLYFYTLDGTCTQQVTVGRHVHNLFPMKDAVLVTYSDQGVYDDLIGQEVIVVAHKDGTLTSQRAFAEQHGLQYDICFAKVKPYACLSYEMNGILHFNEEFELLKVETCPFETGNVLAMSYYYPYFLFVEEARWICLREDGLYEAFQQAFSYNVRSVFHRGAPRFIGIFEQRVVGYSFE